MKIAIDIGHNCKYDGGAVGILKEDVCTMEVGLKVIEKLRALGHEVITVAPVNPTSQTNALYQRTKKANDLKAELFCAIHFNAGGGTGSEVFAKSEGGKVIAARVSEAVSSALGLKNRGVKDGSHLYVINHTDMVAILVECLFIDTPQDAAKYDSEVIANAIVKGLVGNIIIQAPKEESPSVDPDVAKLQKTLNILKVRDYEGKALEVDGQAGPRTKSAVTSIQKILGITADGNAGSETFGAINKILEKPVQKRRVFNEIPTRYIQYRVGAEIDGSFGPITEAKVIRFQTEHKPLEADGVVGPKTWSVLLQE